MLRSLAAFSTTLTKNILLKKRSSEVYAKLANLDMEEVWDDLSVIEHVLLTLVGEGPVILILNEMLDKLASGPITAQEADEIGLRVAAKTHPVVFLVRGKSVIQQDSWELLCRAAARILHQVLAAIQVLDHDQGDDKKIEA